MKIFNQLLNEALSAQVNTDYTRFLVEKQYALTKETARILLEQDEDEDGDGAPDVPFSRTYKGNKIYVHLDVGGRREIQVVDSLDDAKILAKNYGTGIAYDNGGNELNLNEGYIAEEEDTRSRRGMPEVESDDSWVNPWHLLGAVDSVAKAWRSKEKGAAIRVTAPEFAGPRSDIETFNNLARRIGVFGSDNSPQKTVSSRDKEVQARNEKIAKYEQEMWGKGWKKAEDVALGEPEKGPSLPGQKSTHQQNVELKKFKEYNATVTKYQGKALQDYYDANPDKFEEHEGFMDSNTATRLMPIGVSEKRGSAMPKDLADTVSGSLANLGAQIPELSLVGAAAAAAPAVAAGAVGAIPGAAGVIAPEAVAAATSGAITGAFGLQGAKGLSDVAIGTEKGDVVKAAMDAAMVAAAGGPALKGYEGRVNAPKASMEAGVAKAAGVKSSADSVRAMRDQAIADAKAGADAGRLETGQAKETRRTSNQRKTAATEAELEQLPFGLRHFVKALRDATTPKPDIGKVGPETQRVQRSEIARDVSKDLEAKYKEQAQDALDVVYGDKPAPTPDTASSTVAPPSAFEQGRLAVRQGVEDVRYDFKKAWEKTHGGIKFDDVFKSQTLRAIEAQRAKEEKEAAEKATKSVEAANTAAAARAPIQNAMIGQLIRGELLAKKVGSVVRDVAEPLITQPLKTGTLATALSTASPVNLITPETVGRLPFGQLVQMIEPATAAPKTSKTGIDTRFFETEKPATPKAKAPKAEAPKVASTVKAPATSAPAISIGGMNQTMDLSQIPDEEESKSLAVSSGGMNQPMDLSQIPDEEKTDSPVAVPSNRPKALPQPSVTPSTEAPTASQQSLLNAIKSARQNIKLVSSKPSDIPDTIPDRSLDSVEGTRGNIKWKAPEKATVSFGISGKPSGSDGVALQQPKVETLKPTKEEIKSFADLFKYQVGGDIPLDRSMDDVEGARANIKWPTPPDRSMDAIEAARAATAWKAPEKSTVSFGTSGKPTGAGAPALSQPKIDLQKPSKQDVKKFADLFKYEIGGTSLPPDRSMDAIEASRGQAKWPIPPDRSMDDVEAARSRVSWATPPDRSMDGIEAARAQASWAASPDRSMDEIEAARAQAKWVNDSIKAEAPKKETSKEIADNAINKAQTTGVNDSIIAVAPVVQTILNQIRQSVSGNTNRGTPNTKISRRQPPTPKAGGIPFGGGDVTGTEPNEPSSASKPGPDNWDLLMKQLYGKQAATLTK